MINSLLLIAVVAFRLVLRRVPHLFEVTIISDLIMLLISGTVMTLFVIAHLFP